MIDPEILAEATRCYAPGCDRENQLVVHLSDDPWGGSDLCLEHAKRAMDASGFCLTCDCGWCERARAVLYPEGQAEGVASGPPELAPCVHGGPDGRDVTLCPECHRGSGKWVIGTVSGSRYLLDLSASSQAWVTRLPDPDAEGRSSPPLRRDAARIRLAQSTAVVLGDGWTQVLDLVGGGIQTIRSTSAVAEVAWLDR